MGLRVQAFTVRDLASLKIFRVRDERVRGVSLISCLKVG